MCNGLQTLADELQKTHERLAQSERKVRDLEQESREKDYKLSQQSQLQLDLDRMTETRRKLVDSSYQVRTNC